MKKIVSTLSLIFALFRLLFGQANYTVVAEKFYEDGSRTAYFEIKDYLSFDEKVFIQKTMETVNGIKYFSFFADNEKMFMFTAEQRFTVEKIVALMYEKWNQFMLQDVVVVSDRDYKQSGYRASPCSSVQVMVCGTAYSDMLGLEGEWNSYGDGMSMPPGSMSGEESVFLFTATVAGTYRITTTVSREDGCNGGFVGFHIMSSCSNTSSVLLPGGIKNTGGMFQENITLSQGQTIFIIADNHFTSSTQQCVLNFTLRIACLGGGGGGTTQPSNTCSEALPFCTSEVYSYPMAHGLAGLGTKACCVTTPSPTWYYLKIDQPGNLNIYMSSPGNDIDFVCWGPFNSVTEACTNYQSSCGGCPNNTNSTAHYPYGNVVDCSFDPAKFETCHINNAQTGKYYLLLITNYSNSAGNITFSQVSGTGSTDCSIVFPIAISNSPVCEGEELRIYPSIPLQGTDVIWVKPDGTYTSDTMIVVLHATPADTGIYSLLVMGYGEATTTQVTVYAKPDTTYFFDSVCILEFPKQVEGIWIDNPVSGEYIKTYYYKHPVKDSAEADGVDYINDTAHYYKNGCDSAVTILNLFITENTDSYDTVIMCKEILPYPFYDTIFDAAGSYEVVIGCFTHYLELIVPTPTDIEPKLPPFVCADAGSFVIKFEPEDKNALLPTTYSVNFSQWAFDNGFADTQNDYSDSVTIELPDSVYPSIYNFKLNFQYNVNGCPMQSKDKLFAVLYPSSIMQQKWGNVIALYNYFYNGNYDFSIYQWYKNGEILLNETSSYLHLIETRIGDEYSVEITRADDSKCFSCPLIWTMPTQPYLSEFPTIVQNGNNIEIQYTEKVKNVKLWTVTGILYKEINPTYPIQYIELPTHSGHYLLDIQLNNNERKAYNVVVK